MGLADYRAFIKKRWLTVAAVAAGVFAAVAIWGLLQPPSYVASTRVFFASPAGSSISEIAQGSSFTGAQMRSFSEIARSPLVLDAVAAQLGSGATGAGLEDVVATRVPEGTVILEIVATASDAERAAEIANGVSREVGEVAESLYPLRADGTQSIRATVLDIAMAPASPAAPDPRRIAFMGIGLAATLGLAAGVLRDVLDTRIRSVSDLRSVTDLPAMGAVEDCSQRGRRLDASTFAEVALESLRQIRTNLDFAVVTAGLRSLMVTSSLPSEGKTTIVLGLASALSRQGRRIVVVDADLRRPAIAEAVGLEGSVGLTTVLLGSIELENAIQPWPGEYGFDVLCSGAIPPNPSELLASEGFLRVMQDLSSRYDLVLLDSAPVIPVTDSLVLGGTVDAALLVVDVSKLRTTELRKALAALAAVRTTVAGIVLNRVARSRSESYGYGHYSALDGAGSTP